ncbi:hypothetical protein EYZ11_009471 [Aspergillus tanneri]|uniref:Uncharacterized protein n=1 Tax=Aspergillus tanneri TaxID=1220188 RepID=A0A4V3UNF8_9EURO|nr:hypothetical protein EYZ11_009471 [Aspergillus tanneri]
MTTSSTSNALGENKSNENPVSPIVLIVSETLLNSGPSSEALTVHRLLGPELYNHASTTVIDFNSIAPTFIYKALEHVLEKESHHSKRYKFPGAAVLRRISQSGDIRSAISSLEFLCVKGEGVKERKEIATRVRKKPRNVVTLTPKEEEYLKLISQRESSLGLFHAVGKIVYNKRENKDIADEADRFSSPPDPPFMKIMCRPVTVHLLQDALMGA